MTNLLKPVICAVNGLAVGTGFEMLLRADLVIAAEHAQFMLPEVRIGMAPDVGTFMLPKLLQNGMMTPNEAREKEDMSAYPDGDQHYMAGSILPIGGQLNAQP